ncbi:MAG: LacI family transcriptional regulator [Sediminibacterium sp.]|nr:LacI family transcriptional regulator [Sediminibacterium sp.]
MSREKEITIYDIARELDLSAATVSRGLKDHPAINKHTKKKISDLASKLGYRTNNFASNLRKQRTNTIGVIVHELRSQFITSVLAGIEKITNEANYDIIITHSSETFAKEAANTLNLFHKRVDGVIASLAFDTENLDHFEPFERKGIPVIFFDRVFEEREGTKVVINNMKAGYDATKHLIEQGCKRIAHITANLKRNVYSERLKGYQLALAEGGLKFSEKQVVVDDLSEEASIRSAQKIMAMKPMPDGIFITNDFCAAICIQTLKEAGIRIPEDIAIVGFNNDVISKIIEPKLTTINYPGIEIGEIVARNLINHLQGNSNIKLTNTIIIKSELIVRESSLKKKK